MTTPLLKAVDLGVCRGEELLFSGQSFEIYPGQGLQLQGHNGCGKTTLLRALCTLIPLDEGKLYWRGELLPGAREDYFSDMTFSGHDAGLKDNLTAIENLRYNGALRSTDLSRCEEVLQQMGLSGRENLPCRALSAGQRRRVNLARILLSDALVWILDEPLTALDANGVALVETLMAEQLKRGGVVLYSTHQPVNVNAVQTLQLGEYA